MSRTRISVIALVIIFFTIAGLAGVRKFAQSRSKQLFGAIVERVETSEMRVALTFDDGPTEELVDSIIRVLDERQAKATFFVTGQHLEETPKAGQRLVSAGHELGNHSYSHERMVFRSQRFIRGEIERADSLIKSAGQRDPIYFRPPFGAKLITLPWYLAKTDRITIMCDVEPDSYPEVAGTADGIVKHVLERVRPGSIILLHIWYQSRATSLAAVGPLVDSLQARGYAVGTVGELMQRSPTM